MMKINWGTGLVIGMLLFIGFILFFVFRMSTDKNLQHDLVTESYYQKEMELQDVIYAKQNAASMKEQVKGFKTDQGYVLEFPKNLDGDKIKGTLSLYRTSNKTLDFEIPLKLSDYKILIPDKKLLNGRWNITIDWEYEGKSYLFTKEINY